MILHVESCRILSQDPVKIPVNILRDIIRYLNMGSYARADIRS